MTTTAAEGFREIARDMITPNPNQPRKHFDTDALEELAQSIREEGLLEPLIVRPAGERFQLVAGERRWRAAGLAGVETLPCRVMDLSDERAMIVAISENVNRRDMDEMEEAAAYGELVRLGKSVPEIASKFGKTEKWIEYSLELLRLLEPIQWLVARGQLSKNVGCFLSRLSPAGQQAALARISAGEFATFDAIIRHCEVVQKVEAQGGFFGAEETDELTETRRKARRTELDRAWAKVEALSAGLTPFLEASAEDLAFAVGSEVALYVRRLDVLATACNRARNNVRTAAAVNKVAIERGANDPCAA